jgi:chitin disaccharide deacetylase
VSSARRILIVNADDFGRSLGVNAGVVRSHEAGIVTSASLMVRWQAASAAAAYAHTRPALAVGLHLDLGEWRFREDEWEQVYEVIDANDPAAVESELERQLSTFRTLLHRDPTHLDSHQHVHRKFEPVCSAVLRAGAALGIPVRGLTPAVTYSGAFYGQRERDQPSPRSIEVEALLELLAALPAGTTELGCHPGATVDFDSAYGVEREREVETLCDPRVRASISAQRIELRSFADFDL